MQGFDGTFSLASLTAVAGGFTVTYAHRAARLGIFGAKPCIMCGDTFIQIIRDACVKAAVITLDDINMPRHEK